MLPIELDNHLLNFYKNKNITPRPNTSNGFWLAFLLPISIILTIIRNPDSPENFRIGFFLAFGLLLSTIIFIFSLDEGNSSIKKYFLSSSITTYLLILCMKRGILFSLLFGSMTCVPLPFILTFLMKQFPKSFTFGEASIFAQSFLLFILKFLINLYEVWYHTPKEPLEISTIVLQIGLFGVSLIVLFCNVLKKAENVLIHYFIVGSVTFGFVIPALYLLLNQNPLFWVFGYLIHSPKSIFLLAIWTLATICAVTTVSIFAKQSSCDHANTVTRKYFHLLAVIVFTTGIIFDPIMIYLSSGVVLAIFIILELIMVLDLPPFGDILLASFNFFGDEKDVGKVAFSPIYLLTGCAFSLWMNPFITNPHQFEILICGILSIGVGDSFASLFGKYFGRHFWPGSKRTYEGTFGYIVSQSCIILLFYLTGIYFQDYIKIIKYLISIVITSLIEAKTGQVDNLILPIVMYIINV